MPSMEDAPKPQNGRVGIGGVQESGAKIGRRNLTGLGHAFRARSTVRVGSTARVIGGERAGKGPRAMGVMRPRCAAGTRCRNLESGPNVGGRNPAGPLARPQKQGGQSTEQSAPRNEMWNFFKLKEEVVKHAQSYIQRHALAIGCTLTLDHEAVKCLSAFGDQAQKFAAEILATIEWGTQHWKLQESFPVPLVPKWLRMLEVPQGTHYKRYLRALPSGVGLNGLAPAILAGSHDSQSVWGPLLSSEQSCQHPHLGLGH